MNRETKWQYHEQSLHFKGPKIQLLTQLGQQGWELCGIMNDQYATAYFKRPIYPKPPAARPPIKKRKYKE